MNNCRIHTVFATQGNCTPAEDTKVRTKYLIVAINQLDASDEEMDALQTILFVEGFGGREDGAISVQDATMIARERLEWLRDQRADGYR